MKVVWTDFAEYQLHKIYIFLYENTNDEVASRIILRIINATKILASFPAMGTREKEEYVGNLEYRYLIEGHYKIVYQSFEKEIVIQDVFDSRQDPSKILKDR